MPLDSRWYLAKITRIRSISKVRAVSVQKWSKRLRLWVCKAHSLRQPRNSMWVLMRNIDSKLKDFRSLVTKIWHQMLLICAFPEISAQPVSSSQNSRSTVTRTRTRPRDLITVKLLSQSCKVIRSRNKEVTLAVLNNSSLNRRWLLPWTMRKTAETRTQTTLFRMLNATPVNRRWRPRNTTTITTLSGRKRVAFTTPEEICGRQEAVSNEVSPSITWFRTEWVQSKLTLSTRADQARMGSSRWWLRISSINACPLLYLGTTTSFILRCPVWTSVE